MSLQRYRESGVDELGMPFQDKFGKPYRDPNARTLQDSRANPGFVSNVRRGDTDKYRGGNNVYYKDGCPALMSDGRFITYYNSTNELTNKIQELNGFTDANKFRTFMQDNAKTIMASERLYNVRRYACAPNTACSQGFYDLWSEGDGNWAYLNP